MCGLIAGFNKKPPYKGKQSHKIRRKAQPVNERLIEMFDKQETRGTKGFGFIKIDNNNKVEVKRSVGASKFLLDIARFETSMAILHHRNPTSTDNLLEQTHPILVENEMLKKKYLLVHNGVIRNAKVLKKKHNDLGFVYTTEYEESYINTAHVWEKFNDTESLAIEVALFIEGLESKIGTDGGAAFIVLQMDKNDIAEKVYFGRHVNPLIMERTENSLFLSSEGKGESIEEDLLFSFDIKDPEMKLEDKIMEFEEYKEPIKELPKPKQEQKQPIIKPLSEDKIFLADRLKEYKEELKKVKNYEEVDPLEEAEMDALRDLIDEKLDECVDIMICHKGGYTEDDIRSAKSKTLGYTFQILTAIQDTREASNERCTEMAEEDMDDGTAPNDDMPEVSLKELSDNGVEIIQADKEDDTNPIDELTKPIGYDVTRNLPMKKMIRPEITEEEWDEERRKYSRKNFM